MSEPATGDALRRAMQALLAADAASAPAALHGLLRALSPADVVVPVHETAEGGPTGLAVQETQAEVRFFAYTDAEHLGPVQPVQHVELAMASLAATVVAEPTGSLVLDAGHPHAVQLGRRELGMIVDGTIPDDDGSADVRTEHGLRIFRADPELAQRVRDPLAAVADRDPSVRSIVLVEASVDGGPRHPMLVVDAPRREAVDAVVAAASGVAWPGLGYVDVVPAGPQIDDAVRAAGIVLHAAS